MRLSEPLGCLSCLMGFSSGGSRPTPSTVRGGGGGTGRPTWSARPKPLETKSRKDTTMKPSTSTLERIAALLEEGIPTNKAQLRAMANRVKEEVLELIRLEMRKQNERS